MNGLLDSVVLDLRYARRGLARRPAFTFAAVLTLALGIGATTAIFSVVNAVLLRPLPYGTPDRIVRIVENVPAEEAPGGVARRTSAMNVDELDWWRTNARSLSHIALIEGSAGTLATDDGSVPLAGAHVSPALFEIRDVPPLLGRGLLPEEERADVVVLGEATWREYFRADSAVVGDALRLDGRAYTIVGVMPPEFGAQAFWTPLAAAGEQPGRVRFLPATARLRDGVSLEAANAEINALGLQLRGIELEPGAPPRFEVVRELDQITERVVPALRVLVAAVAAVLLIVCTNVANLLLVRGMRREQEIAIRRSLGATRGRIVRQVLTESLLLAAFAGLVGIVLASVGVDALKSLAIANLPGRFAGGAAILPRAEAIAVDPAALAFGVGLSLVTGALFGVLPALRLSRFGERGQSAEQLSAAGRHVRIGRALATGQLGCAMALLVGAGLLLHSFVKLASVDPGFDARGVLSFELVMPGDASAERKLEVAEELAARLDDHPLVTSAGFTELPPLLPGVNQLLDFFVPEGTPDADVLEEQRTQLPSERTQTRYVSPGYLRALDARLVDGRWPDEASGARRTVLVSRPYAQRYFPGRSAVGSTLRSAATGIWTIAGVVDDIRFGALEGEAARVVFMDPRQWLAARRAGPLGLRPEMEQAFLTTGGRSIPFAARVTGDPLAIVADLRSIARDIDPALAVDGAIPFEQVLSGVTARPRFYTTLLGVFGATAAFIALIGIYGLLAFIVGQRTKEIGVRMALGAERSAVLALVLRQGAAMIAIGVALGLAGAAGLTRYLEGLLFGLTPLDPLTYACVAAAFAAVALLAAYLPARRATAIDPVETLRAE